MTLSEVHQAILNRDPTTFGPMDVRVVNFVAKNPFRRILRYEVNYSHIHMTKSGCIVSEYWEDGKSWQGVNGQGGGKGLE